MKNRKLLICFLVILLMVFTFQIYAESISEGTTVLTESPVETGSITLNKQVVGGLWHVACDVMGDQAWVKDEISNPEGIKSREGHRLAYCGDASHWIIYVDNDGIPIAMDEIHSGATGGTLSGHIYTDGTYTKKRSIHDVKVGERIYWTTENKDQVWHHTGITTVENPVFQFTIGDDVYMLGSGDSVTIDGVQPGVYEVTEQYNPNFIIGTVSTDFEIDKNSNVVATVTVNEGQNVVLDFVNTIDAPDPPIEDWTEESTEELTELVTEFITEKVTEESPTEKVTELVTESSTEEITEQNTELSTETVTEKSTESLTEILTESNTEVATEKAVDLTTEAPTEKSTETEKLTEKTTEKQTEKPTERSTEKQTEKTTERQTDKSTEVFTEKSTKKTNPLDGSFTDIEVEIDETIVVKNDNPPQEIHGVDVNKEIEITQQQTEAAPKTGDDTPIWLWSGILAMALVIVFYIIQRLR